MLISAKWQKARKISDAYLIKHVDVTVYGHTKQRYEVLDREILVLENETTGLVF